MSREDAPMRFKAIRRIVSFSTKDQNKYVKSGDCPALFKEDHDFDTLLDSLFWDRDAYEIVTVVLTVVEEIRE